MNPEIHKPQVRLFVGYGHGSTTLMARLVQELMRHLEVCPNREYSQWDDRQLRTSQEWEAKILEVIGKCCAGLLLICPYSLASDFTMQVELKELRRLNKKIFPVFMSEVDFETQNLQGLKAIECFGVQRPFDQCHGRPAQRQFAFELYKHIDQEMQNP